MLLALDLGNTNTVLGIYRERHLVRSWRLSTDRSRTVDEYGILIRNLLEAEELSADAIRGVIIASVVPPLDSTLQQVVQQYIGVDLVFATAENAGIPVLYDDPREVGADRIVDAVAVIERYSVPAIIVDAGTATTFDAITRKGEYLGGLLAPGIEISANALIERAAKLPRIEIRRPDRLIGQSTVESLESGFYWGYVSLVDGIVERMKDELGEDSVVVATGGMAHFVQEGSRWISTVDLDLTLDGLHIVARRLGLI